MARNKFEVEVLTPDGEVFKDEVEMLSTRTGIGSIGLLAGHQPMLALLEPTELRLYRSESEIVRYAQAEGYLQMSPQGALVLVEEALDPDKLDSSELQRRLDDAKQAVERADEGSAARARAESDVRRAEAFLEIAKG